MLLIQWTDQDIVHHPVIDEQHRAIIATINTLQYFIDEAWPVSSLHPTIEALEHYVMFHFKTEETILLKQGMPEEGMKMVREYRSVFFQKLREKVYNAIFHEKTQILTDFLVDWWAGHQTEFHDKLSKYFDTHSASSAVNE